MSDVFAALALLWLIGAIVALSTSCDDDEPKHTVTAKTATGAEETRLK